MISINILARAPVAGQVKTRLIATLGAEGAANAHKLLLRHVVGVAKSWCRQAPGRQLNLWCTPDEKHPYFDSLLPPEKRFCQPHGDLGRRLAAVVENGLQTAQGVVLLGGDCASVSSLLLDQVADALTKVSVVMASAEDGGYILLATTRMAPELFVDIPWGSERVAEVTRKRLHMLGWSFQEFFGQWDVDRPEDWQRFKSVYPDDRAADACG